MAKRNVSEIETGVGYFMGFATGLMDVVREKAVPFAAIYRLVTAGGRTTLGKIADLAYADWLAEQSKPVQQTGDHRYRGMPSEPLPLDHYRVTITYAPLPPMRQLEEEFSKGGVSSLFDGREWKKHASCVDMDETPGEKVFLTKDFGRSMDDEEAIAWGQKNGYRPATHKEAYEFAKAHPELQLQFWIVACGSSALGDVGLRYVAVLCADDGRRLLDGFPVDGRWIASRRFLFVRK
ncbi:MAG: hypothetical protein AAB554_02490 [Patescibacteria group bacterium]